MTFPQFYKNDYVKAANGDIHRVVEQNGMILYTTKYLGKGLFDQRTMVSATLVESTERPTDLNDSINNYLDTLDNNITFTSRVAAKQLIEGEGTEEDVQYVSLNEANRSLDHHKEIYNAATAEANAGFTRAIAKANAAHKAAVAESKATHKVSRAKAIAADDAAAMAQAYAAHKASTAKANATHKAATTEAHVAFGAATADDAAAYNSALQAHYKSTKGQKVDNLKEESNDDIPSHREQISYHSKMYEYHKQNNRIHTPSLDGMLPSAHAALADQHKNAMELHRIAKSNNTLNSNMPAKWGKQLSGLAHAATSALYKNNYNKKIVVDEDTDHLVGED